MPVDRVRELSNSRLQWPAAAGGLAGRGGGVLASGAAAAEPPSRYAVLRS
jgi:hypothetical protein